MHRYRPYTISAVFIIFIIGATTLALTLQRINQIQSDMNNPPGPAIWLDGGTNDILTFSWIQPNNLDLAGYQLRYTDTHFPQTITDGKLFANIQPGARHYSISLDDFSLPAAFYFSLFAYDTEALVSEFAQKHIYCDLDDCILVPMFEELNSIHTLAQAQQTRQKLIKLIWGNQNLPGSLPDEITIQKDDRYPEAVHIETLLVRMANGMESTAVFFTPNTPNGRLMLFHQGHMINFEREISVIRELLTNGYSVVLFNMPLIGINLQPRIDIEVHNDLAIFDHPLHFFIEPVIVTLNYLTEAYSFDHIAMMGFSGGGWTTSMTAALDTRIDAGYSIAGGYPIYVRDQIPGNQGDLEQRLDTFWSHTSYLEVFILAGEGRPYSQFFIYNDPCCSQQSYANSYQPYVEKITHELGGEFRVFIDNESDEHIISQLILEKIFDLENAQ